MWFRCDELADDPRYELAYPSMFHSMLCAQQFRAHMGREPRNRSEVRKNQFLLMENAKFIIPIQSKEYDKKNSCPYTIKTIWEEGDSGEIHQIVPLYIGVDSFMEDDFSQWCSAGVVTMNDILELPFQSFVINPHNLALHFRKDLSSQMFMAKQMSF